RLMRNRRRELPRIAANCGEPVARPRDLSTPLSPARLHAAGALHRLACLEPAMLRRNEIALDLGAGLHQFADRRPAIGFWRGELGVDLGAPLRKPGDLRLGLRGLLAQSLIALAQLGRKA